MCKAYMCRLCLFLFPWVVVDKIVNCYLALLLIYMWINRLRFHETLGCGLPYIGKRGADYETGYTQTADGIDDDTNGV